MDALKDTFQTKKQEASLNVPWPISLDPNFQGAPALITFVTAGYPSVDDTVPILLAMQDGDTDIIELGIPFSDPIADGPAIQETNSVRTTNHAQKADA